MRQYYLQSTLIHFSILAAFVLFQFLRPAPDIIWLDGPGFDLGGGGGGDGVEGDGKPAPKGVKDKHRGQVVPEPTKEVLPEKPAPVQKETRAEDTIAVKDPKKKPEPKKKQPTASKVAPVGEKEQKIQSNKIRRGTETGEKSGSEFGLHDGQGTGTGRGIGIGLGDGSGGGGFGFGGYARVIYKRILEEWLQYTPIGVDKSCVVGITIRKNGQVTKISLERSSGDPMFDNMARRAVRNASPLPPLPPTFPKPQQRFRLNFKLLE